MKVVPFQTLRGKTIESIAGLKKGSEHIFIKTTDGYVYMLVHDQDCCEKVSVDEVYGDRLDLIGSELLVANEVTNKGDDDDGTHTWTFYKLATKEGYVDIKWYGSSNGYYSEEVTVYEFDNTEKDAAINELINALGYETGE